MRQHLMLYLLLALVQIVPGLKFEIKYSQHLIKCIIKITEREFNNKNPVAVVLPYEEHTDAQKDRNLLQAESPEHADAVTIKPFVETYSVLLISTVASKQKGHNSNKETYYNKDNNYIIFLRVESENIERTTQWLRIQINSIKDMYKWKAKSRFVIAILEHNFRKMDQNLIKRILQEMYSHSIVNTILLVSQYENKTRENDDFTPQKHDMNIGAYTWFPYQNPESCHKVKDISLIDTWLTEGAGKLVHNARFFPSKIKNDLKGCPIRVASFNYPPFIGSIKRTPANGSGPDKITYEGGSLISLLHVVAKAMNVSAVFIEPPPNLWGKQYRNGSWDGITGQIANNLAEFSILPSSMRYTRMAAMDYTIPYNWGAFIWWVPCAKRFPRWKSITRVFSLPLWLFGLASTIITAFFMLAIGKNLQDTSAYREISSCLATSWAVLLGVSVSVMPRSGTLRVLFIAWVCYSLAINTVFQAFLTSYLIDPGLEHQISNLHEIIGHKIECGTDKYLATYIRSLNDPQMNVIAGRLTEVKNHESAVERIATRNDFALLAAESATQWYIYTNYLDNTGKGLVCPINERLVPFLNAWEIRKASALTGRMNRILRRLIEAGLTGFWLSTERQFALLQATYRIHGTSDDEYCDLSMEHLQGAFYLLLLGQLVSTVVLLLENLCKKSSQLAIKNK